MSALTIVQILSASLIIHVYDMSAIGDPNCKNSGNSPAFSSTLGVSSVRWVSLQLAIQPTCFRVRRDRRSRNLTTPHTQMKDPPPPPRLRTLASQPHRRRSPLAAGSSKDFSKRAARWCNQLCSRAWYLCEN